MNTIKDVSGKTVRVGDKISCPTPTGLGDRRKLLKGTVLEILGEKTIKIISFTKRGVAHVEVIDFSLIDNSFVRTKNTLIHFHPRVEKRDYGFGIKEVLTTSCSVSNKSGDVLGFGKVVLSNEDTHSSFKARKYSLKKALTKEAVVDMKERAKLWELFNLEVKRKGV